MTQELTVKENPPLLSVRGSQVGLGSWLPEHLEAWMRAIQDPEIGIYSDGSFALPIREKEAEIFEGSSKEGGASFAIYELKSLHFIGSCGLFGLNLRNQTASFGITIIDKTLWGKGYGTEAARLALDYGFRFMHLHNIQLDTTGFNQRAIRAYQKAGFKEIGRRREALWLAGRRYDTVYMDCLAAEFTSPSPGWFALEK